MSSPGHVFVTGVVILADARPVDPQRGNRNVVFDVNFPVKDGKKRTLGLLRYFTPEERVGEMQKIWDNPFTEAFIIARIATMPQTGIPSELIAEEDAADYAFIGDIAEIIFTEGANIHRLPYIMATGATTAYDSVNLTFSMVPSQYINIPRTVLEFPISCFIDAESKKWKNKKPMPTTGSTISIGGFLTKIKRDADRQPTFEIELDNIAYLGRQSVTSAGNIANPSSSTTISRNRFNYDDALSSSPLLSPIATGKRKQTENKDSEDESEEDHKAKRTHTDEESKEKV
ncbi:hypothetical protein BDZ97DRAFT_1928530 [Flammula alnicola]|nr:hypothetical protein BDZ97DRAFT_1928530 [Flammula alnicola]